MRSFVENFPFFCIFLAIISGILSAVVRDGRTAYRMSLSVSTVVAVLSAAVLYDSVVRDTSYIYTMGRFPALIGNAIKVGPWQGLLSLVFGGVMALSLLGGSRDLFHDILPQKQPMYFTMVDLTLASLLALTYTNDIFTGYVFIEISTIAACAMVMAKDTGPNLIATIRYLFMSLLGSGLFLIGLTLLISITGYLMMPALSSAVLRLSMSGGYPVTLTVSIGLMAAGLGVKSAMFPFHQWLPDAHGGATTASSAILSGLVLKGYIALLITLIVRVFTIPLLRETGIVDVFLATGILGMILGSISAIREHHIKRMLAYSSVAQVGYIFMGFGLGTDAGMLASCFHMLVHACCKPLLFVCAGRLSAVTGHRRALRNLKGSAYRDIVAGVGFTVGALSMIGIPLFGGFVSKLYFANASLDSSRMVLVLLAIALSTVLNALYYIPALLAIWSAAPQELQERILATATEEEQQKDWRFTTAAVILIAAVLILGIFYHPIVNVISAGLSLM